MLDRNERTPEVEDVIDIDSQLKNALGTAERLVEDLGQTVVATEHFTVGVLSTGVDHPLLEPHKELIEKLDKDRGLQLLRELYPGKVDPATSQIPSGSIEKSFAVNKVIKEAKIAAAGEDRDFATIGHIIPPLLETQGAKRVFNALYTSQPNQR